MKFILYITLYYEHIFITHTHTADRAHSADIEKKRQFQPSKYIHHTSICVNRESGKRNEMYLIANVIVAVLNSAQCTSMCACEMCKRC